MLLAVFQTRLCLQLKNIYVFDITYSLIYFRMESSMLGFIFGCCYILSIGLYQLWRLYSLCEVSLLHGFIFISVLNLLSLSTHVTEVTLNLFTNFPFPKYIFWYLQTPSLFFTRPCFSLSHWSELLY